MIEQERYEALMQVAIDPTLFFSTEEGLVPSEIAIDPYRQLDELRSELGDVMEVIDGRIGGIPFPTLMPMNPDRPGVLVTGFDSVREILTRQKDYFQNYTHSMDVLMGENQIAGLNPPGHKSLRTLIMQAFDKGSVDVLQEETIIPLLKGIIEEISKKERTDLVRDFTCRLPTLLIGEIFQLPVERYSLFATLVADLMNFNVNWESAVSASNQFEELFFELIAERKVQPGDDLISRMINSELDGEKLTDVQMMSFCRAMVPAGIETTTRGLSSLFSLLLTNPQTFEDVKNHPELIPNLVEEVMRCSSPAMMVPKRTTRDVELAGKKLAADTNVWVCLGHANRDPAIWDNPHSFDIHRQRKPHLAFSFGAHLCIGNQLARREMQDAVKLMTELLPNIRLDPAAPPPVILGVQYRSANRIDVITGAKAATHSDTDAA